MERTSVAFNTNKDNATDTRYNSNIYPVEDAAEAPQLKAKFKDSKQSNGVTVEVKIGKQKYLLNSKTNSHLDENLFSSR